MFNRIANIYLLLMMVVAFFFPGMVYAVEMSSKRDCAICHIMWLNDFRTDKETLIEWQPGNVLMKDTQGVVSSEAICYSCHDGYVSDSRSVVWKHNGHPTFVKPSNHVHVPDTLPLSNKDEIYCGTCHSAHGAGAAPDDSGSGMTSFFREKNIDSSLCESCHTNQADFRRTHSHPVKTAGFKMPAKLLELGAEHTRRGNRVICQTCHRNHGAAAGKILIVDNRNSTLCLICHVRQEALIGTDHDLRQTLPEAVNIKQQNASQSGPCGACHIPHNGAGRRLWAKKLDPGNLAQQMCLSCHGEKSGYSIKHIGEHSHPIDIEPDSRRPDSGRLPLYSASLVKNAGGRIQCFTCHEVHQWDPGSAANRGEKDVEGDGSNSFLRISNSGSSAICIECHADKKQVVASDHNLAVTAPQEQNLQGFTVTASGPCSACHVPHNAAGKRLWSKALTQDKDFVSQVCTGCHSKDGAAKAKRIGDYSHPVNIDFQGLKRLEPPKRAAFPLPLYAGGDNEEIPMKIACLTCHEPHTWDPQKAGQVANDAHENLEGDTTNSFLRKVNFPSSELCKTCHVDEAMVDGSAHDLSVTAPEAKNLAGQTVMASGPCGACHLVHNSPNRLKLWARPYGPISEKENIMDSLCTSCHSKGNIAQKKVPPVATHPQGKLINNIMRFNKENKNYTLIFDADGKEVHIGNISCPSCHNAHQWSFYEKSAAVDPKDNLTGRFLRTLSYNMVCIDCHGPDALLKYQYFHDPEKRAQAGRR